MTSPNTGEPPVVSKALELLQQGELTTAGNLLHQAAAEAIALDDSPAAIRLLQLAAATSRSAGAPEEARARVEHAVTLAEKLQPPDPALTVLALSEAAECALALNALDLAARELAQASATPELPDAIRATLLRRQASVLSRLGDYPQARQVLEEVLLAGAVSIADLARVRLDIAALAQQAQLSDRVRLIERAEHAITALDDDPTLLELRADLHLLLAHRDRELHDLEAARDHARTSAQLARQADSSFGVLSATLLEAEILEDRRIPREQVYAALAKGQASMAGLSGRELAEAAFAPALQQRREAWGIGEFLAIAARYQLVTEPDEAS